MEYYAVTVEVEGNENLERVLSVARSMPSYHRIYIDDIGFVQWDDDSQYSVEVFFNNEHDATVFLLKWDS